jgi:hypothetical protein
MNEREDLIQQAIADYLGYLEIGGTKPDLSELDPETRRTVEAVIGILDLTEGIPLGMGRSEGQAEADTGRRPRAAKEPDGSDAGRLLEELQMLVPVHGRIAPDGEISSFVVPGLPIVDGWTVGTFGGRLRVWLIDEPDCSRLDGDVSVLRHLDRAFRGLPDTAAVVLVCRDLSCLLLEPSDCGPAIEAPTGALVARRHRRPIQHVGEAVASFLRELVPPWEPVPEFRGAEISPVDVSEVASSSVSKAVSAQKSAGTRARSPRKDVLSALGKEEVDRLTEMTKKLYQGQVRSEEVISQLRELAEVR